MKDRGRRCSCRGFVITTIINRFYRETHTGMSHRAPRVPTLLPSLGQLTLHPTATGALGERATPADLEELVAVLTAQREEPQDDRAFEGGNEPLDRLLRSAAAWRDQGAQALPDDGATGDDIQKELVDFLTFDKNLFAQDVTASRLIEEAAIWYRKARAKEAALQIERDRAAETRPVTGHEYVFPVVDRAIRTWFDNHSVEWLRERLYPPEYIEVEADGLDEEGQALLTQEAATAPQWTSERLRYRIAREIDRNGMTDWYQLAEIVRRAVYDALPRHVVRDITRRFPRFAADLYRELRSAALRKIHTSAEMRAVEQYARTSSVGQHADPETLRYRATGWLMQGGLNLVAENFVRVYGEENIERVAEDLHRMYHDLLRPRPIPLTVENVAPPPPLRFVR